MSRNEPGFQARLRDKIDSHFNLEEVKLLCTDMGVEYEHLSGETRPLLIQALIDYLADRNRLDALYPVLRQKRPTVDWPFPDDVEAEPPFKGLQFFTEADQNIFFGREALTGDLMDHLRQHRFLAVVGASGSGKSSVVRAGIVPAIRAGAIEENGNSSKTWPIHIITPGDEPLKALATTLTRDSDSVRATKVLLEDLRADGESLDLWLFRHLENQPDRQLLLVVDQFEELFTQTKDIELRRLFVENLSQAVQSSNKGRLKLILTLRADFYHHCAQYDDLRRLLETEQKYIGAMTTEELRRTIEKPAKEAGLTFEAGLVDLLLRDISDEPGALPLLSHALLETWKRREGKRLTLAGYTDAGRVQGAIAQTADDVYRRFTADQQAIARNIFLRLTELGEGVQDTRRRATAAELIPQDEGRELVSEVLIKLADARLVTTSEGVAEVAHEALIREWPALQRWLDEDRAGLRIHRQLTEAAQAWQRHDQDRSYLYSGTRLAQAGEWAAGNPNQLNALEQAFLTAGQEAAEAREREREAARQRELEQAQRLAEAEKRRSSTFRWAVAGLSLLLILALGAVFFAIQSAQEADRNAEDADNQRLLADDARATAEAEGAEAERQRQIATTREVEAENARATAEAERLEADNQRELAEDARIEAELQQAEAERQQQIALAQSIAALSGVVFEQEHDSELATLLAIEAARINQTRSGSLDWLVDRSLRPLLSNPIYFNNTLSGHQARVLSVAFSPDSKWLASGSDDQTVRLWLLLDQLVEIGCQKVRRNLTWDEWQRYLPGEDYRQTCPNLPVHPSVEEAE